MPSASGARSQYDACSRRIRLHSQVESSRDDLQRTVEWISQFYVAQQHQGQVLTDFDETRQWFAGAVFGLAGLLDGQLDRPRIEQVLAQRGYNPQAGQPLVVLLQTVNRTINTEGGPYFEGDVNVTHGNVNA